MKLPPATLSPPIYSELVEDTVKRLWATISSTSNFSTKSYPLGDYRVSIYSKPNKYSPNNRYSIHLFFNPISQGLPPVNVINAAFAMGELIWLSHNEMDTKATLHSIVNDILQGVAMKVSQVIFTSRVIEHLIKNEGYEPAQACKRVRDTHHLICVLYNAGLSPEGTAIRVRLSDVTRENI